MKEDLRHKNWMIALFCLGHVLLILVAWLIWRGNMVKHYGDMNGQPSWMIVEMAGGILTFFREYLPTAGGCLSFLGAMIAGLFGFRFVFYKNRVDLYHALPVKRSTLYGVCWINGILSWFIPYIACLGAVLLMGCSMAQGLPKRSDFSALIPEILKAAGYSVIIAAVVYLLVYHLVLIAVMLTGNLLNALISMMVLGFGTIAAYGLGAGFFNTYMGTFYAAFWNAGSIYASPLFAALVLLNPQSCGIDAAELWSFVYWNLAVALVLGVCAWQLYRRRNSESAEQGIGIPAAAAGFRILLGTAGGMCGWVLFVLLVSDTRALGWGIFGAVLAAVCVFGTLDMIFQMDVRAFFSHKLQMTVATGLSLLICFLFFWDWIGYDTYLPDREDIAEIAVFDRDLTNSSYGFGASDNKVLENMHFQDKDVLYAFLEHMVENEEEEILEGHDPLVTKITLNSGKSYYRRYWARREDKEVVWPILNSEEYLKNAFQIDYGKGYRCREFRLETDRGSFYEEDRLEEHISSIISAYNQDLRENPEKTILGEGRLLANMFISMVKENAWGPDYRDFVIDVYESMEHTVEALEKAGYEVCGLQAEDVQAIELSLECVEHAGAQERIALAREVYGVWSESDEEAEEIEQELRTGRQEEGNPEIAQEPGAETSGWETMAEASYGLKSVAITDREEVEEMIALLSVLSPSQRRSVFGTEYSKVKIRENNGSEKTGYLPKGTLPEKYIFRFGE